MAPFVDNNNIVVTESWRMVIYRLKSKLALMLVVLGLLGGCASFHFRTDNWGIGLSEMAQDGARIDCQTHIVYTEYRDCIARVNKNYDDWRSQQMRSEKNTKPEK